MAKKKKSKNKGMRLWLVGAIIGGLFGILTSLPLLFLSWAIPVPQFLSNISNLVYIPAIIFFAKIISPILVMLSVKFTLTSLFYTLVCVEILFYALVGLIIGWLVKLIKQKIKERND